MVQAARELLRRSRFENWQKQIIDHQLEVGESTWRKAADLLFTSQQEENKGNRSAEEEKAERLAALKMRFDYLQHELGTDSK